MVVESQPYGTDADDTDRRREQQDEMVRSLNAILADFQVLYQKLRGYHWNVEGDRFFELHELFETMYGKLEGRIDVVAEQIRVLERHPDTTYSDYLERTRLEEDGGVPDAEEMVHRVYRDLQWLNSEISDLAALADEAGSRTTVNLLENILDDQVKTAWMLRSYLS